MEATVLLVGQGVLPEALAKRLTGGGLELERTNVDRAAQVAQVAVPELVVLAGDAASDGGKRVLQRMTERAAGELPTLVICGPSLATLGGVLLRKSVAALAPEGGLDVCAQRIRSVVEQLVKHGLAGRSLQQLVDGVAFSAKVEAAPPAPLKPLKPAAEIKRDPKRRTTVVGVAPPAALGLSEPASLEPKVAPKPEPKAESRPEPKRELQPAPVAEIELFDEPAAPSPVEPKVEPAPEPKRTLSAAPRERKSNAAAFAATVLDLGPPRARVPTMLGTPAPLPAAPAPIAAPSVPTAAPPSPIAAPPSPIAAPSVSMPAPRVSRAAPPPPIAPAIVAAPAQAAPAPAPATQTASLLADEIDVSAGEETLIEAATPIAWSTSAPAPSPAPEPISTARDPFAPRKPRLAVLWPAAAAVVVLGTGAWWLARDPAGGPSPAAVTGSVAASTPRAVPPSSSAPAKPAAAAAAVPTVANAPARAATADSATAVAPAPPRPAPSPAVAEPPAGDMDGDDGDGDSERVESAASPTLKPELREKLARANRHVLDGHSLLKRNHLGLAEAAYLKALAAYQDYPRAMSGLARVHIARKDGAEAVRWAKRLVAVQPKRAANQLLLGDAWALRGNQTLARAAWQQAQRLGSAEARKRLR